jgi:hypothetical protein
MHTIRAVVAVSGVLALGACAVAPPAGPTVLALPAEGKPLAQFQQEDLACRNFAQQQTGVTPAAAANQSAIGSAAIGTGLGAAAGALLGAAAGNAAIGAAAGAGTGLLMGSSVGASNAAASAWSVQQRYDVAYSQCMVANGNHVPVAQAGAVPYGAVPMAVAPAYAYPYPYPAPWFGGTSVAIGFGGGCCWGNRWGNHWGGGWHHW